MANEKSCPVCGKPVKESGLDGLCPECMLKAGFPTGTEPETGGEGSKFVAPPVEEIRKLFPHLEIIELIGRGGMGAVYKARQKELDRLVALKILPPGVGEDRAFAARFVREAKALAKLNHPNIVTLHQFDQADGLFYFIMEFVDGVNLRQLLQAGRIAPREALAIVPQICDALQYAHDHGIVHRDIKPENILLDRKGQVKVADFGVARLVGIQGEMPGVECGTSASASVSLTEAGKVMGTPQYMAPEQKARPAEVDHRADIYSLGVVFYQMLTGELPGKRIEAPSKKFHLDVRLDEVVLRALEKEPALRFQQASQFKTQVETIISSAETSASAPTTSDIPAAPPVFQRTQTRLSRTAIVGASLLGFTMLLTPFLMWMTNQIRNDTHWHPSWSGGVFVVCYTALWLLSGCAGTVLGWVAVTQIRRSAGRLHGLKLALFDGLLLPLWVLDWVMLWVLGATVGHALAGIVQSGISHDSPWRELCMLGIVSLEVIVVAAVDIKIIRRVWHTVKNRVSGSAAGSADHPEEPQISPAHAASLTSPQEKSKLLMPQLGTASHSLLRLGLLLVITIALTEIATRVTGHWRESDQERWFIPFAFFAAIASVWLAWPFFRKPRSLLHRTIGSAVVLVCFVILSFASNFYGNYLVPRFVHPGMRSEIEASFGRTPPNNTTQSEIEQVVVSGDKAVVTQRNFNGEGMRITFGAASNRWEPRHLDSLFAVTLESPWLGRGANWIIRSAHGAIGYNLETPTGTVKGEIVFHPGKPVPETEGSYVIAEFHPDEGQPLPIAVKLVTEKLPSAIRH